jgi:DNA repair exonuclease SbcCD ATPase subunit
MKYILIFSAALLLFSCQEEPTQTAPVDEQESAELINLRNQLAQMEFESRRKDSVINESIAFFNEIQENLAKITVKEDQIRIKSQNPEISEDEKEWIRQEIQNINYLREENARKIRRLQGQLKEKDLRITELENMINRLTLDVKSRDEKIEALQIMLADRDMEYLELFDQYQEQVELALEVMKELNTVYYAYGTIDELVANEVLVREGGFIGIGKKTNVADNFNKDYFQKMDKTRVKKIKITGNKPQIVTDHPSSSYRWEGNEIVITDPDRFWKISRFLVVQVK